jgi:L-aspartate oxidase
MHPFDKNLFRTGAGLATSSGALDRLWTEIADHAPADTLAWREAAALVATARWSVATAAKRTESRGMHRREDFPATNPEFATRLLSSGLDQVRVAADGISVSPQSTQLKAAL